MRTATFAAMLVLVAFGCTRPKGSATADGTASSRSNAPDASGEPVIMDASVRAEASAPVRPVSATDAGVTASVPWIRLNADDVGEPPARVGGHLVDPEIELPSRSLPDGTPEPWTFRAAVEASFPFLALRTRGLPAVSADGARVAHVFGPFGCCRGTGYSEFSLYVFDAKSGATVKKVLLWSLDDELRIPQRDGTGARGTRGAPGARREMTEDAFEKNLAAYEALLRERAAAARAALSGAWTTLGDLAIADEEDGRHFLRGDELEVRLSAARAPFPPVVVTQSGTKHTFPGARFRVALHACPSDSMALRLEGGFGLRDRPFAIVETSQGYAAPDGCEGSRMELLTWTK